MDTKKNVEEIAVKEIELAKFNPRKHFDEQKLKDLAHSITEKGVIEPLIVRPVDGKYEIVCGERRFKASEMVELKTVPVVIRELTDTQAMEFQIIENLQREDLDPVDEAMGFKAMIEKCGYTHEMLAEKIGKSRSYIANRIRLLGLSKPIQEAVSRETISPGHAMVILRIEDPKARADLFKQITEQEMSIRYAERELFDYTRDLKQVPFERDDCKGCMFQGANQKELVDKDNNLRFRCLNPECYLKKVQAYIQSMRDKLKKKGFKVFTEKEIKSKGFDRYSSKVKNLTKGEYCRRELGPKYQKNCCAASCVGRVFIIVESRGFHNEGMQEIQEWCIDPQCYAKLTRRTVVSGEESVKMRSERQNESKVRETKRRIWIKEIGKSVTDEIAAVMVLYHLVREGNHYGYGGDELIEFGLMKKGEDYWHVREKLLSRILKMDGARIAAAVRKLIVDEDTSGYDDSELDCIAGHLGFDLRRDFIIDELYLKTRTKEQLVAIAKEIKLKPEISASMKKTEMIKCFLKKGFDLKGKVPNEVKKKDKEG